MNKYLQFIDLGEENDIRCLCEALKYYEHPLRKAFKKKTAKFWTYAKS